MTRFEDKSNADAIATVASVSKSSLGVGSTFEYQFQDETCKFYVCVFHAREFHALREKLITKGVAVGGGDRCSYAK